MTRIRTSLVIELHLDLHRGTGEPLHRQVECGLREAVRSARLPAETPLPSSRSLAAQLSVSRGIVVEAYEQLVAEGYLESRPGGVTRVARTAQAAVPRTPIAPMPHYAVDFRPGRPDLDLFPRDAWLRSLRRAMADAPSVRFGYLDGRGVPELREALATYLNRVRGTAADPNEIVITTGFAQGLHVIANALRGQGIRRIGMEDPSDPQWRSIVASEGLEVVGLPIDDRGLRIDRLEAADVQAAIVTAAHQYPTGGVLPPERRAALVDWAGRVGGVVVEDDYDAEFRYDREPIGAIQGLRPERVVYAGSASKMLAPGLRLGWLLVPSWLIEAIEQAKAMADLGSPAIDQLAFADFIGRGELDHHLRRMRPIYRRRRDVLLAALGQRLPDLIPIGVSAGLHVMAWLPEDVDEAALVKAASAEGIALSGLGPRHVAPDGRSGLVFGYGAVDERGIEAGIRRIADLIAAQRLSLAGSSG